MISFKGKTLSFAAVILALASVCLGGCSASKEINPDKYIELGQYKGLHIEKQVHEVTEEEMEDELKTLVSAYAQEEVLSEAVVEDGDIANIDYEGKRDGVPFNGGTAAGHDLEIGSEAFIPGFEDGLIGVAIGDTVDLPLTFPENYYSEELAGAEVIFTVTVNSIKRRIYPELTDEFIEKISDGKYHNLDEYEAALKEQIISEYDEMNELQYYEDLWNLAVDNATVKGDLPNDLVSQKTSRMVNNALNYAKVYGLSFEDFLSQYMSLTKDEFYKQSAEYAKTAAKESLVLAAIAKQENIVVSDEEIEKAINEYVELGQYASKEEFLQTNDIEELKEYILTSKVQDFLAENAQ